MFIESKMRKKPMLDFEVPSGTNIINLHDVSDTINFFPRCHPYRIYLMLLFVGGMRTKEPMEITWDNFRDRVLIFRPEKTDGKRLRKIRIPDLAWQELEEYKSRHFFRDKKLFWFSSDSFRSVFDHKLRQLFRGKWLDYSTDFRKGRVGLFHSLTLRSFRPTAGTLVYRYYSQEYGHGDVALSRTASWLGHSTYRMTAEHYIKKIDGLGLWEFPTLPLLELLDFIIYKKNNLKLTDYIKSDEHQAMMLEY